MPLSLASAARSALAFGRAILDLLVAERRRRGPSRWLGFAQLEYTGRIMSRRGADNSPLLPAPRLLRPLGAPCADLASLIAAVEESGGPARVWLEGSAGAGKSAVLLEYAVSLAKSKKRLPVLVDAADIIEKHPLEVAEAMLADAQGTRSASGLAETLRAWAHHGRLVLLVDGAGRVPSVRRSELMRRLACWGRHLPRTPIVVTARPGHVVLPGFVPACIGPLDASSRGRWLAGSPESLRLLDRLCGDWPHASHWLTIPLFVDVLAELADGPAGAERLAACERAVEILFDRAGPTDSGERAAMERLADVACAAALFGRPLSPPDISLELRMAALREPEVAADLASFRGPEDVVDALVNRIGLFVAGPDGLCPLHPDLVAWLAARHLDARPSRAASLLAELPRDVGRSWILALAFYCAMESAQCHRWEMIRRIRPVLAGRIAATADIEDIHLPPQ